MKRTERQSLTNITGRRVVPSLQLLQISSGDETELQFSGHDMQQTGLTRRRFRNLEQESDLFTDRSFGKERKGMQRNKMKRTGTNMEVLKASYSYHMRRMSSRRKNTNRRERIMDSISEY